MNLLNSFLKNPHPSISSFPIAILTLMVIAELAAMFRKDNERYSAIQRFLLLLLCVFAVIVYFSGYWAAEQANQTFHVAEDPVLTHQGYAKFSVLLVIPLVLLFFLRGSSSSSERSGRIISVLFRVWLATCWLFFGWTSALGGGLVFGHGAGVHAPPAEQVEKAQQL